MSKILIVEDEPIIAEDIAMTLRKLGHTVVAQVNSETTCLDAVKKHSPDLIMMDINLSKDVDGIDIAEVLRYEKNLVKIIYLTAYADNKTIDRACKTDPSAYLVKPFKRRDIDIALKLAFVKTEKMPIGEDVRLNIGLGFTYSKSLQNLYYNGVQIALTCIEKKLFFICLENRGNIVSYDVIEEYVWSGKTVSQSTQRGLYFRLRTKLNGKLFETVANTGCRIQLL